MAIARLIRLLLIWSFVSVLHADESDINYTTNIKPLLVQNCSRCHGPAKQQASLRVDSGKGLIAGGDSGPIIVPGNASQSLLIHALTGTEGASQMPPEGDKLSEQQIALIRKWIDAGAHFPADEITEASATRSLDHWSFKPVQAVIAPDVINRNELQNPIDNFIRRRLEQEQLLPSKEAERTTLIRRVHLDLLGVPPQVEDIHQFISDSSDDAYERLLDRLLASPHFGERWGRDWLDAARYADSNGFTRDQPRTIWRYRDWVIDALNSNLPYDQFVIHQLAGDLLPNPTLDQLIATGFHRNTLINEEGGTDPEQFRVEAVIDRTNTTSSVFLGLTAGCAQCHDHKYDPISQREYYQLYAFFNSTEFVPGDPAAPRVDVPTIEQFRAGEPEKKASIRAEIRALEDQLKDQAANIAADLTTWEATLTEDDKKQLPFNVRNAVDLPVVDRSEVHKRDLDAYFRQLSVAREKYPQLDAISKLRAAEPKFATTMITREIAEPRQSYIHIRGDFLRKGTNVEATIPAILTHEDAAKPNGNRLGLAEWIVSKGNPLTARVVVNRYWQRFFSRGIVETENDFGTQGDPPTHPELLDWLAAEFRQGPQAWNTKHLMRVILTSATYRQSSNAREDLTERDPVNKLLARQSRMRIDAEMIRDAALTTSGLLTEELGGSPVYPPQPEGVFDFTQDKKPWKTSTGRERFRKGMYTHLWRSSLYPAMAVFDFPEPNVTCTRRVRSNTPLQSLTLANDETFVEFAKGFASRLLTAPVQEESQRLEYGFELAVGRAPNSGELARLRTFLYQQRERFQSDSEACKALAPNPLPAGTTEIEAATWTAISRVLLNLDEFITRE